MAQNPPNPQLLFKTFQQWWQRESCIQMAEQCATWLIEGPSAILHLLQTQNPPSFEQVKQHPRWTALSEISPYLNTHQDFFAFETACQFQLKIPPHWKQIALPQLRAELAIQVDFDSIGKEISVLFPALVDNNLSQPIDAQTLDFIANTVHRALLSSEPPILVETKGLAIFFTHNATVLHIATVGNPVVVISEHCT